MIDLNNLIDLLPSYYREEDTYKDPTTGKGLLEQFLNICGAYLKDYPKADLDNFLENLDVTKTNEVYINNFWRFFGELPFARGLNINPKRFQEVFTGFNFDEALEFATGGNLPFEDILGFTVDYRRIIKYAVSLFKIRGTDRFFEVMFRMYGLDVDIDLPDLDNPFLDDTEVHFDDPYTLFDSITYDKTYRCRNCSTATFTINNELQGDQKDAYSFYCQIKAFVERFVPFYVSPTVILKGSSFNFGLVNLSVDGSDISESIPEGGRTYYDHFAYIKTYINPWETSGKDIQVYVQKEFSGDNPSLAYLVGFSEEQCIRYTESGGTVNREVVKDIIWGSTEYTDTNYHITQSGFYYFKPVSDTELDNPVCCVEVGEEYTDTQYMMQIRRTTPSPCDFILTPTVPSIEIEVCGFRIVTSYKDGVAISQSVSPEPFYFQNTGDLYDGVNKGYFESGGEEIAGDFVLTEAGYYTFYLQNNPGKQLLVYVGESEEFIRLRKTLNVETQPIYIAVVNDDYTKATPSGTVPVATSELTDGVWVSDDGNNWNPGEFSSVLTVKNGLGEEVTDATIKETTYFTTSSWVSGDTFYPATNISTTYVFKASKEGCISGDTGQVIVRLRNSLNPVIGSVVRTTDASIGIGLLRGGKKSITITGTAVVSRFDYNRDNAITWMNSLSDHNDLGLRVHRLFEDGGVEPDPAILWIKEQPDFTIQLTDWDASTSGGKATYNFSFTWNEPYESTDWNLYPNGWSRELNLGFIQEGQNFGTTSGSHDILVVVNEYDGRLWLDPIDSQETQWDSPDDPTNATIRNFEATHANTTAKYIFRGTSIIIGRNSYVTDEQGNTHKIYGETEEVAEADYISFESDIEQDVNYTWETTEDGGLTATRTLHYIPFIAEVEISCEPTVWNIYEEGTEVKVDIYGTTNVQDTFQFYEASSPGVIIDTGGAYPYTWTGTYTASQIPDDGLVLTFVAVDDPTKTCTILITKHSVYDANIWVGFNSEDPITELEIPDGETSLNVRVYAEMNNSVGEAWPYDSINAYYGYGGDGDEPNWDEGVGFTIDVGKYHSQNVKAGWYRFYILPNLDYPNLEINGTLSTILHVTQAEHVPVHTYSISCDPTSITLTSSVHGGSITVTGKHFIDGVEQSGYTGQFTQVGPNGTTYTRTLENGSYTFNTTSYYYDQPGTITFTLVDDPTKSCTCELIQEEVGVNFEITNNLYPYNENGGGILWTYESWVESGSGHSTEYGQAIVTFTDESGTRITLQMSDFAEVDDTTDLSAGDVIDINDIPDEGIVLEKEDDDESN